MALKVISVVRKNGQDIILDELSPEEKKKIMLEIELEMAKRLGFTEENGKMIKRY